MAEIHQAVEAGDASKVRRLLDEDPSQLHARGWMGATPLHDAAWFGQPKIVDLLLERGADPMTRRTDGGDIPLHLAFVRFHGDAVQRLLEAMSSRDIDARDDHGQTPLHSAARFSNARAVRTLLDAGADVTAKMNSGETALHVAEDAEAANELIAAGGPLNEFSEYGQTPLHAAAHRSRLDVAATLLRAGADPTLRNGNGVAAMHVAQQRQNPEMTALFERVMDERQLSLQETVVLDEVASLPQQHVAVHLGHLGAVSLTTNGSIVGWQVRDGRLVPQRICATTHSGLYAAAFAPDGERFVVACGGSALEVRSWPSLELLQTIPAATSQASVDWSPNGQFIASCKPGSEEIFITDILNGTTQSTDDGGERMYDIAFSPDAKFLATPCSFQGGGTVLVDELGNDGSRQPHQIIDAFEDEWFADTLASIAFSPDGAHLAIWTSSAILHERRVPGWRGDLTMWDVEGGKVLWQLPVGSAITGNSESLKKVAPMGFVTQIAFTAGGDSVVVGLDSVVVIVSTFDRVTRTIPIAGRATAVATCGGNRVLAATDKGLLSVDLGPSSL